METVCNEITILCMAVQASHLLGENMSSYSKNWFSFIAFIMIRLQNCLSFFLPQVLWSV